MPTVIELAANVIVQSLHEHRNQLGDEQNKSIELFDLAESIMDTYGIDDMHRGVLIRDGRPMQTKRATNELGISIPFSPFRNCDGQTVYLYLADAGENFTHSGYIMELSVPTLLDTASIFYFRKDPTLPELSPTVKNWNNEYAGMPDLIVAEQLLGALQSGLEGKTG